MPTNEALTYPAGLCETCWAVSLYQLRKANRGPDREPIRQANAEEKFARKWLQEAAK